MVVTPPCHHSHPNQVLFLSLIEIKASPVFKVSQFLSIQNKSISDCTYEYILVFTDSEYVNSPNVDEVIFLDSKGTKKLIQFRQLPADSITHTSGRRGDIRFMNIRHSAQWLNIKSPPVKTRRFGYSNHD
jgi:hypothetical protein